MDKTIHYEKLEDYLEERFEDSEFKVEWAKQNEWEFENFISKVKELQKSIIDSNDGLSYCQIRFDTHAWAWGIVSYRLQESKPQKEEFFTTREHLIEVLESILQNDNTLG